MMLRLKHQMTQTSPWTTIWMGRGMYFSSQMQCGHSGQINTRLFAPTTYRRFCKAKPVVVTEQNETHSENETNSEKKNEELNFVKNQTNLRQIFLRKPADGLYPAIKPISEIEAPDVENLVNTPVMADSLEKLISTRAFARENPKLVNALIQNLYDKNGQLIEKMFYQLLNERLKYSNSPLMSSLNYNLMMQSAALFKRHMLLDQLTFESTIFDMPVDNQTFIKTIMCLYYDLHRTQ